MTAKTMLTGVTRLSSRIQKLDPRCFLHGSAQAAQSNPVPAEHPRVISRTSDSDPAKHGEQHEGKYYSIPIQDLKTVFPHGLPPRFRMQVKTFGEACLMVRKPALELLGYLKNTKFSHPAVRYLLYGEKGTGKTLSLCHAVHFCAKHDWLVLHIPDAHLWVKNCRELLQSTYNKQRFDQPLEASTWLKNFKTTNKHFLSQIAPEELALVHSLRKMVKNDWHGGAIVLSLSQTGSLFKSRTAYLPHELLGKEGFDALDPFLPILTSNYNPKEFESSFQYYLENNWLQHEKAATEEGKKELKFLSNCNPGQLERLCASL
ncbi:28S ribosomal protein S29, mitochondrial isoform X4 [Mesocricetus auratus]|uniref:Small ribosomal subunit protein mS29 n=1 Tax=Mesocricetus auratus TaxID=10036 RepID=A0ABM2Y0F7_MESAU|nr:28S ribosomal protein S29, mitochondrial isoform X4 [Mesocricetus auratus]